MPVGCSRSIAKLSKDDFRELDYRVMRHAFFPAHSIQPLALIIGSTSPSRRSRATGDFSYFPTSMFLPKDLSRCKVVPHRSVSSMLSCVVRAKDGVRNLVGKWM